MWFAYIIYSKSKDKYYIGHTGDVKLLLERHNMGWSHYTSSATDWTLRYSEKYPTKSEVMRRDCEIKRKKSRKYIEQLITAVPVPTSLQEV